MTKPTEGSNNYVYAHYDPESGALLYIGNGTHERAWSRSRRSKEHLTVLDNLNGMGYCPEDYSVVLVRGLTRAEAYSVENLLIKATAPCLNFFGVIDMDHNRGTNNKNARLTEELVTLARISYRGGGISIRRLARDTGVAYTTMRKVLYGTAWTHI